MPLVLVGFFTNHNRSGIILSLQFTEKNFPANRISVDSLLMRHRCVFVCSEENVVISRLHFALQKGVLLKYTPPLTPTYTLPFESIGCGLIITRSKKQQMCRVSKLNLDIPIPRWVKTLR